MQSPITHPCWKTQPLHLFTNRDVFCPAYLARLLWVANEMSLQKHFGNCDLLAKHNDPSFNRGRFLIFEEVIDQQAKKSKLDWTVKRLPTMRETQSIPGSGRSPAEGNGNPLQYSCLENPMDRGAWWATLHGVAKSWTCLSDFSSSLHFRFLVTWALKKKIKEKRH